MERVVRILQVADEKFHIQEFKEYPQGATFITTEKTTGRWPFRKTEINKTRIPKMVWFTWRDFTQPTQYDAMAESFRHPFYAAHTIEAARDHAKKVLADAIKYPLYHEI